MQHKTARRRALVTVTGATAVLALVAACSGAPAPNPSGSSSAKTSDYAVLTPTPTFVMYRITARGHGLKPVEVPLDAGWDLDVSMTKRAIAMMQPSVVFVASPNNPTGNRMSLDRLEEIVAATAGEPH